MICSWLTSLSPGSLNQKYITGDIKMSHSVSLTTNYDQCVDIAHYYQQHLCPSLVQVIKRKIVLTIDEEMVLFSWDNLHLFELV